ncbi:MAG TPA: Bax inhibitor-1/YccA family protein, partial [Candidatus Binataceae bacterium]|nr:Bax inhibitor-1/YccA family protein [Candidatus Binataceae bacterium]
MAANRFNTSNPALKAFRTAGVVGERAMTIEGTAEKTAILLILASVAAMFTWRFYNTAPQSVGPLVMAGALIGFGVAIFTTFKPLWAPITAPMYAVFEGVVLGGISAAVNSKMPGIAGQAVFLTFAVLAGMLIAYRTGIIKVTERFRMGVAAATFGIVGFYLIAFVSSLFGGAFGNTIIYGYGFFGIGFSAFVVTIAALNLTLDFDSIARLSQAGAPQAMEWYGGFVLLITLVWL